MPTRRNRGGPPRQTHRPSSGNGGARRAPKADDRPRDAVKTTTTAVEASPIDIHLLKILRQTLSFQTSLFSRPEKLNELIQRIKGLLYDKRFLQVFKDEELLAAYIARWVPGRVGCFREAFSDSQDIRQLMQSALLRSGEKGKQREQEVEETEPLDRLERKLSAVILNENNSDDSTVLATSSTTPHWICIGGGACSELLAILGLLLDLFQSMRTQEDDDAADGQTDASDGRRSKSDLALKDSEVNFRIDLIDIGPYGPMVDIFRQGIHRAHPTLLSRRKDEIADASPSVNDGTFPTTSGGGLDLRFHLMDVLEQPVLESSTSRAKESLDEIERGDSNPILEDLLRSPRQYDLPPKPTVITILFTLTELFLQSRAGTVNLLRRMTSSTEKGTLLLVMDSANEEASSVNVGTSGRVFSLATILDGILLSSAPAVAASESDPNTTPSSRPRWELLESEDSRWYRIKEELQGMYPIKIENTRYWKRLYRKL